ncbi:hypothetical protein V5F49_08055 [Xanthobacter sp. V3C-3]|uniref:hypothetical protein n=1 Tax=Xanthobacter lutulentifluminis TaxID=3119935 RepID=UPI0037287EDF
MPRPAGHCPFRPAPRLPGRPIEGQSMLDLVLTVLAAGLFALAIGYGYACERL